jgi:alpha-1,3-rhamnosyl/mannosyltransferase
MLFAGESLIGQRSGVGRMTAQIAQSLRASSAISEMQLTIGSRIEPVSFLDQPTRAFVAHDERGRASRAARAVLAALPILPAIRRAQVRRRMNAAGALLSARHGGRVVYFEPNLIAKPFDGRTVLTVHDLSWRFDRRFHPPARVAWIERRLPASLAQAARIVCISRFTASELARLYDVAPERIDLMPLAAADSFRPMAQSEAALALARLDLSDRSYFLGVSTREPRKNFDGLLAAYEALPAAVTSAMPLVVVGGAGWGDVLDDSRAHRAVRQGRLRLVGHIADSDLCALYARAAAFAFPSLYEGFGLPVLEAMAAGAPVVTSRTTALGEVAGDAAILVDPADQASIAQGLLDAIDADRAADLRLRGFARVRSFGWEKTANALIESCRSALAR